MIKDIFAIIGIFYVSANIAMIILVLTNYALSTLRENRRERINK